ncbi:MAG TPA: twin-arginine translocation signal domain-containing protein, partial [Vicinamibacteria bacterium]|nr:twin-arginine translocation signal domain-containing protein [Vicinamibacteria bacterium]
MAQSRRDFLKRAACGAVGLSVMEPLLSRQAGSALAAVGDKIIVVVNLFGGNDGLNTVIPLTEYARYRQMRPHLGHERASILPLSGQPDF